MPEFSHTDKSGKARMVDVGGKPLQKRTAIATGFIRLQAGTLRLIRDNAVRKGDVMGVARIAGIQAAKKTSELIPLCHPLQLSFIDIREKLLPDGILIESEVQTTAQTGVEMEALTAVQVALLTIYDMCKSADKNMVIENVFLKSKTKS